jgi:hypothetical protein
MRRRFAVSAILGLSMTALAAPASVAGPKSAQAPTRHLSAAAFKHKLAAADGVSLTQKLRVASRVQQFSEDVYWYHKGKSDQSLAQLHARFNKIFRYVVGLVADRDPALHATLVNSRTALWHAFADKARFLAGFGRKIAKRLDGRDPQLAANQGR